MKCLPHNRGFLADRDMNTQQEQTKGIDQWQNQLYAQVSNPATFEKLWNSDPEPKRECVVYDWPDEKIKQS